MYKRVIVKIGTNVITRGDRLVEDAVRSLVDQIAALRKRGVEVVVVTSGAVATGREILGRDAADTSAQKQAFAAVGQVALMALYARLFEKHGSRCAQILVTKEDFRDKAHYANMKNCFEDLLRQNIVPIVNENDTVSIHELVFTDNDELAGLIGSQLNADAVIFLTSVEGVLKNNEVIPRIRESDVPAFKVHVSDERSAGGRGGMRTKFTIAQRLMRNGITVHVVQGTRESVLPDLIDGREVGTTFIPTKKVSAVKRRLSYSEGLSKGVVYVDEGAERILRSQSARSLLPVGIARCEGAFKKGEVIEIRDSGGRKLGFGIAGYDAGELEKNIGKKGARAFIHYDYMVIE